MNTRRLAVNALLAAMCTVLSALALNTGSVKISFEDLPVLVGALLFGPLDGLAVGGIGTLLFQLTLSPYGVTLTTPLWILPYALCGLLAGWYARKRDFTMKPRQTVFIVFAMCILTFLLNTFALFVDSKIYGYYFPGFITANLLLRSGICLVKAAAFTAVLPTLMRAVRRTLRDGR